MKTEIMIAVLALLCIGSLAVAFVLWAKLDEQKQKTKDEHDNYMAALRIANTNAEAAQAIEQESEGLNLGIQYLTEQNDALQDFKSSVLCPTSNHVWSGAICTKCGRVKR